MENHLLKGERIDVIGFGNLRLIQKPEDFCYGVDAVILADFAAKKPAKTMVDLGTGTGIIPLILSHKTKAQKIIGVEVQKESFKRACRNVTLNGMEDRLHMICENVSNSQVLKRKVGEIDGAAGEDGFVDVVVSNPPYTRADGGMKSKNPAKMIARHELEATLEDFIKCASILLKDKGDFYMVHRPSRIADICCMSRKYQLEPKELQFISAKENSVPNILLIHCVKKGGNELKLKKPLYIYDEDGNYTNQILRIYEKIK